MQRRYTEVVSERVDQRQSIDGRRFKAYPTSKYILPSIAEASANLNKVYRRYVQMRKRDDNKIIRARVSR